VLSIEGWLTVFYSTADLNIDTSATTTAASQTFTNANDSPVLQPVQNTNRTTFVFFLFYIVVFSFFFLQTFVATILSNIAQHSPTGRLTTEQLQWFLLKQQIKLELPVVTSRPITKGALSAASLINRREFDMFALVAAIINAAFIAIAGTSASQDQRDIAWYISIAGCFIELLIFAARSFWASIEAQKLGLPVGKVAGFRRLFVSLLLLIASCIELGIAFKTIGFSINSVRCSFAILSLLLNLFLKGHNVFSKHTAIIIYSMEHSLGQFLFAIIFLALCIMLFTVIGHGLFAGVKRGPGITADINFDDAPHAMLLLFRIATGESWQLVQKDCSIEPPYCTRLGTDVDDCGTPVAWLYFDFFFLLTRCVFLNLFTVVVLEQLSIQHALAAIPIRSEDIHLFKDVWAHFDPEGKGVLPLSLLEHFIHKLAAKGGVAFKDTGGCVLLRQYPYRAFVMKGFFGANVKLGTKLRRPTTFQLRVLQAELLESLLPGAAPSFTFKDTLFTLSMHAMGARALHYDDFKLHSAKLDKFMDLCAYDVCLYWWNVVYKSKRAHTIFHPQALVGP